MQSLLSGHVCQGLSIFAGTFGVHDVVFLTKFTVVYDEDAKPARRDFSTII